MLRQIFCLILLGVQICTFSVVFGDDNTDAQSINRLLEQADDRVWLGIANKGASRAFEEGLELLELAEQRMDKASVSPEEMDILEQESQVLREQLVSLSELYEERYYGVFPLARLLVPTILTEAGLANPEHLFHPPEIAAIEVAGRDFSDKVPKSDIPYLVLMSEPMSRKLEVIAFDVLAREGTTIPISRRELVKATKPSQLTAFDAGHINQQTILYMMNAFNAESLIVAKLAQDEGSGFGLVKYVLRGDHYLRGEAVQGSPLEASPVLRVGTIVSYGSILDRRAQFWPIILVECLLLLISVIWASGIHWSLEHRLSIFYRAMIGLGLFAYGRLFAIGSVMVLNRIAPSPEALLSAAWWWPSLLGLLIIIGSGSVAWIAQAQFTSVIPGARGARAVGTIFALSALGGMSYFVAPVLLLEETAAYAVIIPFVLCGLMLAVLFGFAVRTGPPVPHYFAFGPLLITPFIGFALLKVSPALLWMVAVTASVLCIVAVIRHFYAVKKGVEEPELSSEAAAEADTQRLMKLSKRLARKD